jgi:O-antigen ligase
MTASGLLMGVLVLASARLALRGEPLRKAASADLRLLALVGAALAVLTFFRAADLFAVETERLFVAGLAAAAIAFAAARGPWPTRDTGTLLAAVAVPLAAWALVISRTRNAWLGALVGLSVLAVLRAPRALWALMVGVVFIAMVSPRPIADRLTLTDASSRDRYYMWQAGIDMVLEKPVFGQGPGMVKVVYPEYRWPGAPNPQIAHLHDNALQIAAERGLPCVAWWLWWVAAAMGDALREARRGRRGPGWVAAASVGVMAAIMVAGLFEYNFGDSEILMFTLLVSALPYGLRRQREAAAS